MSDKLQRLKYEVAFEMLRELVAQLESGHIPLEETVSLYAYGQELAAHCQKLLEDAELKVRVVEERG